MTLRMGSQEDIIKMFEQMNNERRHIMSAIVQLVYFMRGAIQYDTMYHMTKVERDAVNDFIEKRLQAEAGKTYPVY